MDSNNSSQQLSLEVKTPAGLKVICIKNILYIEAEGKFSIMYLDDFNIIITYHLLKWYDKYLLQPYFFRCHNSYLVNCRFVDCYCNKSITLIDKNRIPLSRSRIRSFKENLKYLMGELS
ncbi:MAG: LytTR family DNA-binding domain-containing protein [Bacteroidales bacterium]|nr:LytTR family DNA-binding domain-containing protein [Bacteroidales bacterium]